MRILVTVMLTTHYLDLLTLVNNILRVKDNETLLSGFVEGTFKAYAELMNPFISESIWTEAVARYNCKRW